MPRSSTAAPLARAETIVYEHRDLDSLAAGLKRADGRRPVIVTDAVFSMDGDLAPLREIVDLARSHRARVIVDEAHATGVVGPGGVGLVAALGLESEIDVVIGTLSKALGSYGAFACCDRTMAHFLSQPRPHLHLLHRAAAARGRRRAHRPRHPSRHARDRRPPPYQRPHPLRPARRHRTPGDNHRHPNHSHHHRRPPPRHRALTPRTPQWSLRPGHTTPHRPCRHLTTPPRHHGQPHRTRPPRSCPRTHRGCGSDLRSKDVVCGPRRRTAGRNPRRASAAPLHAHRRVIPLAPAAARWPVGRVAVEDTQPGNCPETRTSPDAGVRHEAPYTGWGERSPPPAAVTAGRS